MNKQIIKNKKIYLINGGVVKLNYYKLQGRELIEKICTIISINTLSETQKLRIDELMLKLLEVLDSNINPNLEKNCYDYIQHAICVIDVILDFITREELPEIEEKNLDNLMERMTNLIDLELSLSEIQYCEICTSNK